MTVGLLDRCREEQAVRGHRHCTIGRIAQEMSDADRSDLLAALDDPAIQHVTLTNVLRERGHVLGHHTVRLHRRGQCGCAR